MDHLVIGSEQLANRVLLASMCCVAPDMAEGFVQPIPVMIYGRLGSYS